MFYRYFNACIFYSFYKIHISLKLLHGFCLIFFIHCRKMRKTALDFYSGKLCYLFYNRKTFIVLLKSYPAHSGIQFYMNFSFFLHFFCRIRHFFCHIILKYRCCYVIFYHCTVKRCRRISKYKYRFIYACLP